ncbi:MAG: conjugal transfer protein TrbE [Gammaproteobacteria bacterium]|jgi:type IV secretion system protein VirB4
MMRHKEYKKNPDRLADLLPWAALVAPGIILNKDGSLQRTLSFRGPDLASSTESQLVAITARLNNALKRFGSGWVLYIEAKRRPYTSYPEKADFSDPISWLIDAERRDKFEKDGISFESCYYLTLQYLPPEESATRLSKLFITETKNKCVHSELLEDNQSKRQDRKKDVVEFFQITTQRFYDILQAFMFEVDFLDDDATLTYLHSTISTKDHVINTPLIPMYLDAYLADTSLITGISPQLGDYHLKTISILGFPFATMPALLDQLNQLPINYRWMTRFIPLDKLEAEKQLKRYKQKWFSKRKGMRHLLQEVFTKNESQLLDTSAVEKTKDADEALKELAEDYVAYGYYTATITVIDKDLETVTAMQREIEKVINGLGFTTICETFNAVEAWLSSLPGQAYANVRKPLLHTLNLAHLMPFSATWSGQAEDYHLQAPPLMYVHTHGRTPFRFVLHIGDVGHMMVVGPTGAGKSVFLTTLALQFKRYKDAQVFVFDKGGSFLAASLGVNGGYYELGKYDHAGLAFQPLANIDVDAERIWAAEWLQGLLINEQIVITPEVKQSLWEALNALAELPQSQRTLTGLSLLVQNREIKDALSAYTLAGPFGHILDADYEIECDDIWQCYEMEELMTMPSIIAPILSYLFHRLEKRFTGVPTILILDEAWLFLDHPIFADKIRDWLKSLRKKNVSVVFATQSVDDVARSRIAPALLESCPARVLLPNDRILEPQIRQAYEILGLNEQQLSILSTAMSKQQYYYVSRLGNRLFDLELGPIAFAFCAASRPGDIQMIRDILEQHDRDGFLREYLSQRQLNWAWEIVEEQYKNIDVIREEVVQCLNKARSLIKKHQIIEQTM